MDRATTVSDVIYKYLRPLIRQHAGIWSETAGVAGPDFQQVYVPPPQELIGAQRRPRASTVERLVRHLTKDRDDTLTLLTGQKGSGKTFALRRMHDDPAIKKGFHRVFIRATGEDSKSGLPAGDADLRLLLLLLCAEVAREFDRPAFKQALAQHGVRLELTKTLRDWVALLGADDLLTPQNFYDYAAKINLVAAELSWKTRSDVQRRRSLRQDETFAPSQLIRVLAALVRALRDVLEKVDPNVDLLLVLDDTDKYASREEAESMFLRGTDTLREVPCKLVMTFPYWLHFDPRYNALSTGVTREVLSNVKVVTRDAPGVALDSAVAFFREMFARIAVPELLESDDVLREATLLSAGVPREFLRVLAGAFELADEFKESTLTLETLRDAKVVLAREPIATSMSLKMQAQLKYVCATKSLPSARFWELLDSLHVVEYVNDQPWYAVNPLLRDWIEGLVRDERRALVDRDVEVKDVDNQLTTTWLEAPRPVTSHALPLPHRRGVREIARAMERIESGALFVCVGRSSETRAAVEAALREALGGRRVAAVTLADDDDGPWTTILEGAAEGAVVSLSFAAEPPSPALLARINVGREVGPANRVALLVWVGLGALRELQRGIADVWAYRTGVVFLLGREDLDAESRLLHSRAATIREALAFTTTTLTWATGPHRVDVLVDRAILLVEMGRYAEALRTVDEAEATAPTLWRVARHAVICGQVLRLTGESTRLQKSLGELNAVAEGPARFDRQFRTMVCFLRLEAFRAARDWRRAFHELEALRSVRGSGLVGGVGPSCVNLADSMIRLGRLGEAEELLREAEEPPEVSSTDSLGVNWSRIVLGGISSSRGATSHARANDQLALSSLHEAAHRLGEVGSLEKAIEAQRLSAEIYQEIGLYADAQALRDEVASLEREIASLTGGLPESSREDVLAEASPSRCAERALDLTSAALDAGRPNDAAQHLVDATRSHEEDEPRFRSHYLAARIARLQSRLALHRSRPTEALPPLAQSVATLEEGGLHRERLNTLLEIARLPPEAASLDVRIRAARGAWRIARGGGLLVPERDALALRARFARELGALDEAAAHEAVIAEIDEALAAGRTEPPADSATVPPSP